jgi:hypothetical protein
MQNDIVEFFISCGYPQSLEMVKNHLSTRDDVEICKLHVDDMWGSGELYLKGSSRAYKYFSDMSHNIDDPEYWFSIEHFADDLV